MLVNKLFEFLEVDVAVSILVDGAEKIVKVYVGHDFLRVADRTHEFVIVDFAVAIHVEQPLQRFDLLVVHIPAQNLLQARLELHLVQCAIFVHVLTLENAFDLLNLIAVLLEFNSKEFDCLQQAVLFALVADSATDLGVVEQIFNIHVVHTVGLHHFEPAVVDGVLHRHS